MKILGIDYGTKRVGLAISFGPLAEPLGIIENSDTLLPSLLFLCVEQKVEEIVVGLSDREMAKKTQEFVDLLKTKLDLPIHFIDESYSSHQVHQLIRESGMKQKKRQEPIDHFAATYILQEYLDTHTS